MVPDTFVDIGPQLGWILFWIVLAALILLGLLSLGIAWRFDAEFPAFLGGGILVVAVLAGIGGACTAVPYNPAYWRIYEVSGHVESVTNVGIADDDGALTRTPVLTLDTVDIPLTMSDPRAVSLDDTDVTLTCTIGWEYQSTDRYECKIRTLGSAGDGPDHG